MPMAEAGGGEDKERNKSSATCLRERMRCLGLGKKFRFELRGFGGNEDGAVTVEKAPEIRAKAVGMVRAWWLRALPTAQATLASISTQDKSYLTFQYYFFNIFENIIKIKIIYSYFI